MTEKLLTSLGATSKQSKKVTVLAISANAFDGFKILFDLVLACQDYYKREIDMPRMHVVVLPNLEAASKSPHLERASFIFIPGENICEVEAYPELKDILPFLP